MLGLLQSTQDIRLCSQSSSQLRSEQVVAPVGDNSSRELSLELVSMSSNESFKQTEQRALKHLMVPLGKSQRAFSKEPMSQQRRCAMKKNKLGKNMLRLSSRSENECYPDSRQELLGATLGLKVPYQAQRKRADSGVSRCSKGTPKQTIGQDSYMSESTKIGSQATTPMSNTGASVGRFFETEEELSVQEKKLGFNPSEIMENREYKLLQQILPDVDIEDFETKCDIYAPRRQFAPEFSQQCYEEMLSTNNKTVGNYLTQENSLKITAKERDTMITTIQYLHRKKEGYKQETMHLAGNIADRYLYSLAQSGRRAPLMPVLATVAMLIAAKIEQPISPSFNRMIRLLPRNQQIQVEKEDLIDLEEQIMNELEFDFAYASPIAFLERYQRLLNVDQEAESEAMEQIGHSARQFCKYMMRHHQFLEFTPAQQAAAALCLSINLSYSPIANKIGLKCLGDRFQPTEYEITILDADKTTAKPSELGPLSFWSERMENLSKLNASEDISAVYDSLISCLDQNHFVGKLSMDARIWLK